jgi:hypothetical protein
VLPSIPGYGFSAEPTELGLYAGRTAQAAARIARQIAGYVPDNLRPA